MAQDFSVSVDTITPTATPGDGEKELFRINVTNDADVDQQFTLNTETRNDWYNGPYPYTLTLEPGESGLSSVYISLDENAVAGRKGIEISVTSGSGEQVTRRPSFTIKRDSDVIIKSFTTNNDTYNPGTSVSTSVTVRNVIPRELDENEYRAVFTLDGKEKTVPFSDLDPGEEETVTAQFNLEPFDVGVMNVNVRVEDIDGNLAQQKSAKIEVEQVENVQKTRTRNFRGISTTAVLTAENHGNIPSENTVVKASVPSYLSYFVSFTTEPSSERNSGGTVTYTWELGSLSPGDSQRVTYRINYWTPLAVLLVLVVAGALGIRELRSPHIKKKTVRKNGKHAVHLTVKNRSGSNLDNVVVKDFVPSIASLIEKFDSSPPEKIRQGEEGTELEWKLGRMTPGEERILTYKISPQVEVEGSVTLPSARLEYKVKNAEKKRSSHHTSADFR